MSAETVIKKIEEKAALECETIRAEGRAQAEKIVREAMTAAEDKAAALRARAQQQAELIERSGLQQAALDSRLSLLNAKKEQLSALRRAAREKILQMEPEEWKTLYTRLVVENVMPGRVRILAAAKVQERYGLAACLAEWETAIKAARSFSVQLTLETEGAPAGGLLLAGETFDVDLSCEALLDTVFESNEKQLADCLFGTEA